MSKSKECIIFGCLIVTLLVRSNYGGSIKSTPHSPQVVLYGSQSGGRSFKSVAKNYPDLSTVSFDNQAQSACTIGTWIFYGSKNYANFTDGVVAHFSKSSSCFTFQNLSQKVSSFRYAGAPKDYRSDFIDLFSGIFFTRTHLATGLAAVANLTATGLRETNSVIVSGTSPWTLFSDESFTGTSLCVYPREGQLPRFYRNSLDIDGMQPRSVRKGCQKLN